MATTPSEPRFQFHGTLTVEVAVTWFNREPRSLQEAEAMMKAELGNTLSMIRGRIAHVVAPPGNMSVKGQLVDIHHKTSVTVRKESHAPTKTPVPCGDEGLRGPGDEHRPERRAAGDGQGADQRDVRPAGDA